MEVTRKDLIDFAADVINSANRIGISKIIDRFIERKSSKSMNPSEPESVKQHEGKSENCPDCGCGFYKDIGHRRICLHCPCEW